METELMDTDENIIPESTKEESKTIKAINKDTVHKICSGQVVLSLAIAVKELVENAIDAGATIIELKLREYGAETIEVSDNGTGVEEHNFEGLTAKYHTSKIREFSNLETVSTFGFRGEALSSLCALSDMAIITRHSSVDIGTKLELDHKGRIVRKLPAARQIGTTVILSNLFSTLPVRKREFTKNIKKEYTKMCQILEAYCLVSRGVRIICTNQNAKGLKMTVLSTPGSQSVLDNIRAIFGAKQTTDLLEIKEAIDPDEKYTKETLVDIDDGDESFKDLNSEEIDKLNECKLKIEGWISSCKHGAGRSSRDRQFYFINSRPCEPKNVIKVVNQIYHRFNSHQSPFVYLNIILNRNEVDVNLTPDKRQLLINNEKILLLILKKALIKTFGTVPSTYKKGNPYLDAILKKEVDVTEVDSDDEIKIKPNHEKYLQIFSQWKATGHTDQPCKPVKAVKRKHVDEILAHNFKLKKIQTILSTHTSEDEKFESYNSGPESDSEDNMSIRPTEIEKRSKEFDILTGKGNSASTSTERDIDAGFEDGNIAGTSKECSDFEAIPSSCDTGISISMEDGKQIENSNAETSVFISQIDCKVKTNINDNLTFDKIDSQKIVDEESFIDSQTFISTQDESGDESERTINRNLSTINTSIEEIREIVEREEGVREKKCNLKNLNRLKFKIEINPTKNQNAEEELNKEIKKEMFKDMEIIGQFNLGFIITRLDDDLFIIDQHATDEKYNFETLQQTTQLQSQNLVIPQSLELTAVSEMTLIDNLSVFEMNGFKFTIDDGPITKRIKLTAKPFSRNWEFGKEDIDELIFMLQGAPINTICRPSRVRAMFASRACRQSVMIGTALKSAKMRKLVDHMSEIEQPWNCPHGRPTMRHLVNLTMLEEAGENG